MCLTAFLQATILVAGLMVFRDKALLGLGLMLSAGEVNGTGQHRKAKPGAGFNHS